MGSIDQRSDCMFCAVDLDLYGAQKLLVSSLVRKEFINIKLWVKKKHSGNHHFLRTFPNI